MKVNFLFRIFWIGLFWVLSCGGSGYATKDAGFPPFETSDAYQQFLKKPQNNLSKLICGLNYLRTAPITVRFDDTDYSVQFAYPLGLAYLLTHYRNENPEQWIKKHCYRSLTADKIIYFKYADGSMRPARDVFIETYDLLEKTLQKKG